MANTTIGKTTVAKAVCVQMKSIQDEEKGKALFIDAKDADDFHPDNNRQKMAAGLPLDDDDRKRWLANIRDYIFKFTTERSQSVLLIGCSALKKRYREVIREARDKSDELSFVYLKADRDLLVERVSGRKDHYMKENMIQSQLDILEEPPVDEEEQSMGDVITVQQLPDKAPQHSANEVLQAEKVTLWLRHVLG